ncbi:MAG: methylated-DNA--[protein]-cysteine S-methyltransferase [Bdellovibrionales bacterium]|nr:methylated-DNA--[protein]-cysteine S-methyltransferase [Bdellovibrionales bacterium]
MKLQNQKQDDLYFKAFRERDARFDGLFFIGVKTTDIYCRPICPAKPKKENMEFFKTRGQAENAGYRACLRCRPDASPQSPAWLGKTAIVERAIKILFKKGLNGLNEDRFAEIFGVSARHLRRLFMDEMGKTPKQFAMSIQLNRAAQKLTGNDHSISQIAMDSGFKSLRRFNAAFKDFYKMSPTKFRSGKPAQEKRTMNLQWMMKTEITSLYLIASAKGLRGVYWKKQNVPFAPSLAGSDPVTQNLYQAVKQLEEYFAGQRRVFDLPLDRKGTAFQEKVWSELSKIPYGTTLSYKDIARKIKNEKAVRAVGTANGKNPLSIVVPCHRVIAADGSLGGFAGGLSTKTKLLELERQK